ncbi:MAG: 6-carboxytetrahydropterin synthase [Planctomycetota bacterium]|nr:6-carboxytetrahydropterin synthase [Planctomycetota bacterium]MCX8039234.1 6-carboxytetrahydropterin synthase [Planctomycetota bacterium]MDW8372657.1 6-carboxytetrahydropterin synthase [Planctomycetota bacterium]
MPRWSIALEKEYLKFSCAHFLIFPDGRKERLHGHNYRVRCEIAGELDEHGLVIDFIEVKPVVKQLCDELDEHWLLPGLHPALRVVPRDDGHTEVHYGSARYLAPSDEILVLPIANTSAELLAAWFGRTLLARLRARFGALRVQRLRVRIAETDGQDGIYESDER